MILADITTRKRYKELIQLPTFKERYEYLRLTGRREVGIDTFGWDRYLNQAFYTSREWRDFRNKVIVRDNGCDLAHPDWPITYGKIIIHHLNPLTVDDFKNGSPLILDMDNVVCVTHDTHQAIHYGAEQLLPKDPIVRQPNDTCPWK